MDELLAAWDDYLANRTESPAFPPSMTSFMQYIKDQRSGEVVKSTRTDEGFEYAGSPKFFSVTPPTTTFSQESASRVVQEPRGDVDENEIRRVYERTGSLARTRAILKLGPRFTLARLQSIVRESKR